MVNGTGILSTVPTSGYLLSVTVIESIYSTRRAYDSYGKRDRIAIDIERPCALLATTPTIDGGSTVSETES
ncbi:hypothetical protein JCM9743_30330 [Natrinema sp. JCM 9743]